MVLSDLEKKISELMKSSSDPMTIKDSLVDYMMQLSTEELNTIDLGGSDRIYGDPVITELAIDAIRALKNNIPGKRRRINLFVEVLRQYIGKGRVAFDTFPINNYLTNQFRLVQNGLLDTDALEEAGTLFPDNLVTEMKNLSGYKLLIDDEDRKNNNYTFVFSKDDSDDVFMYYNRKGNIGKVKFNKFLSNVDAEMNKLNVNFSKNKNFAENPDITDEKSFRDYAHNIMKNAHGDDYSEEFTNKVVDDLIRDNPDASWGELIGRLTSGLGNKGKNFSSEDSDIIYGLGDFMHEDDKSIEFLPEYDLDYEDINDALDAAKLIASEIEDGIQVLVVEASLSGSNYVASVSSTDGEVKRYENDEEFMKEWKMNPELIGD